MKWIPFVIILLSLAACSRQDEGSNPATRPAGGEGGRRIISTVPAATLNIVQIGGVNTLVGVSKYDLASLPENKRNLPVVGDYAQLNYELLLQLKPTALIIQMAPAKVSQRLREVTAAHGIELVNINVDTLDDLWGEVELLGRVTGHEAEARNQASKARAELAEIATQIARRAVGKPRVLIEVTREPMLVVGSNTFLDEVVTMAGGVNVGGKIGRGYPAISREVCVQLSPEVVLLSVPGEPPEQADDPRIKPWLNLPIPAAKGKRIHVLSDSEGQLITLKAPSMVRDVMALLHPEIAAAPDPFGDAPDGPPALNATTAASPPTSRERPE